MIRNIHGLINEFPPVPLNAEDITIDTIMRLWAKVMRQALFDASYGLDRYYKNGKLYYKIDKRSWAPHLTIIKHYKEAQQWFIDGDEDFVEVCSILSLDPGEIQVYAVGMFKEINRHVSFKWKIKNVSFKLI